MIVMAEILVSECGIMHDHVRIDTCCCSSQTCQGVSSHMLQLMGLIVTSKLDLPNQAASSKSVLLLYAVKLH